MRVIILQRDIVWASKSENLQRAEEAIRRQEPCDLVVLPEMFATGFGGDPAAVAEPDEGGEVLRWMQRMAHEHDCAVAGSVAVGTKAYKNRFYFVKPDGSVVFYDKRHLFTYGGEHLRYTAGDERVVVEWRGVRFLLMVCYDLRFPVWSRNREDYDCALYVASWPTPRVDAWSALLKARAIENQCFVVGVNRVGKDPQCEYSGASVVLDAYGHELAACTLGKECEACAELDMSALEAFRKKFPVLKDREK
ncbi:MAG: amidohydrolase [Bacteroidales bacterium]|nr:amidohydrolase [Bacteroidales bacterium]